MRFEEVEAGITGAHNELTYQVELEVKSLLNKEISLDIFERLPVTKDKTIDIEMFDANPTPSKITDIEGDVLRGGLHFTLKLIPGKKYHCNYKYKIVIPKKKEIIGGNRIE